MDVEDTKSVVHQPDDSVSSGAAAKEPPQQTSLVQNSSLHCSQASASLASPCSDTGPVSVKMLIDNWFTMYYYYLHWKSLNARNGRRSWHIDWKPQHNGYLLYTAAPMLPYTQPPPITWISSTDYHQTQLPSPSPKKGATKAAVAGKVPKNAAATASSGSRRTLDGTEKVTAARSGYHHHKKRDCPHRLYRYQSTRHARRLDRNAAAAVAAAATAAVAAAVAPSQPQHPLLTPARRSFKQSLDSYGKRCYIRPSAINNINNNNNNNSQFNPNNSTTAAIRHSSISVSSISNNNNNADSSNNHHLTGRDLLRKHSYRIHPQQQHQQQQQQHGMYSRIPPHSIRPPARKHPVQLLCELYGKNGLQIECEFLNQPPFRKQKVTYTLLGRKFSAVSHTRDEAKRLCARRALLTLHPDLRDQLQEHIPRQEYDFGYRLNRRHPVDLVNYFFKNEPVLIETEKRGLSHFTAYTVSYVIRGRRYVATAEKQNEAKRRCAILVLNDLWRLNMLSTVY